MRLKITYVVIAILTAMALLTGPLVPVAAASELNTDDEGSGLASQCVGPIPIVPGDTVVGVTTDGNAVTLISNLTRWPSGNNNGTIFTQYSNNKIIPDNTTTLSEITTTVQPDSEYGYIEIVMPDGSVTIIACDAENRVVRDSNISNIDGLLSFTIYAGTEIITPDGKLPGRIVMTEILGRNTSGYAIRVFELNVFDSNGSLINAEFKSPVLLSFRYLPDELPENATGAYIALYDDTTDTWEKLESPPGYTPEPSELAVVITHLSIYGIFADFTPLPPAGGLSMATIIWIIIGGLLVIFLLVLILMIIHRRRKKTDTG